MPAPFTDANRPEVLARVVYQLVVRQYRNSPTMGASPGIIISEVIRDLNALQLCDLRLYASSMYWACITCQVRSRVWLKDTIQRSRAGATFRAACYTGYKATRRDPRVTNRGVGSRSRLAPLELYGEEGYGNAKGNKDD